MVRRWLRSVLFVGLAALAALLVPAAAGAEAAAKVPVRAADYGDHARIVFDWPVAEIKYSSSVAGNRLVVTFGEPAQADLGPALVRLGSWFTSADLEQDGRAVAFGLRRPVKVIRDGRSGRSVYFDVAEDRSAPPLVAAPPPSPPVPVPPPVAAKAPAAPPAPAPSPPPAPAAQPAPAAAPAAAAAAAAAAQAPVPAAAPPPPAAAAAPPVAPALVFDPGQPAAAAVYIRSDQLYMVFDRPLAIGAGSVSGNVTGLVGPVQPVLVTGGSAFRMTIRPWLRPVVERKGTVWRVLLVPKVQPPRLELPVEAQPDFPLGGRLLVHAPDAGAVVELTDPEVGDRLMVVPLPAAVQAVSDVNRIPEAEFLPALQGIVIRPHGDGVSVRPVKEGVEITAAGGLHLSPVADAALAKASAPGATDAILNALGGESQGLEVDRPPSNLPGVDRRLFDIAGWQRDNGDNYTKNRQDLLQTVANTLPKERNRARMELARFYFSHGFNQEATGLLEVLAADQPDVQGWPEFRALRGAARVAAGAVREGLADLTGPGLDDNREAALWRAYASVLLKENYDGAAHDFYLADDLLASYPAPYFRRMSLAAIEARVQTNDPREGERLLKRLIRKLGPESEKQPALEYYRGEIQRESGKISDALKHLQAAEDGGDRYYRARAGIARVNLEFQDKRIAAATAADRLSRLRFAWRGDELELDVIQRHGEMLWQSGEYADGLNTLREAAAYFPESPRATEITQRMTQLFGGLFKDGASKLPPLKAIELYDQFRELTPVGSAGDEVIRQLAERLVEVDLLGRASELLQHQVDFRLVGEEKANVGTRLASIRLLDGKSDLALKALEASEFQPLPPEAVEERRLLKARALAELRRSDEALKLLEGDVSKPADMLRVDIAWHDQRWDDAATALDKVIGPPPAAGVPLDKTASQLVLNRAIALALAGDGARLEALRNGFGPAMAKTEEADAFSVLTRTEQAGGLIDLASIKKRVAEVDVFQNFLKDFHKKNPPPPNG